VLVAQAELANAQKDYKKSIEKLLHAIEKEDNLPYNEPPNWHHPVRQILGNVLLTSGKWSEAEATFREDLEKNRNNGWSLFGLYQSLDRLGKMKESHEVLNAYRRAWVNADFELTAAAF
jgi:tetratricopeptide (TPR) repeat protein